MKKVLFLLAAATIAGANYAQAQEKALKQYGFWDNWFIQGQIGAQRTYSEENKVSSFGDKLSPNAALGVGKFFSPEVGARVQVGGWTSSNYNGNGKYHVNYLNGNVDALFNLTNVFLPYKENRVFNLIGILGAGYVHGFKNTDQNVHATNMVAPRVGLQADFRVCSALSLNLEANGNLLRDDFNGQVGYGCANDGTLNVLAGITYRFKQRGFASVRPADETLIQSLNAQINDQRAELEKCQNHNRKNQAQAQQNVAKETPASNASLYSVVVFRIGSAKIGHSQDINIYTVAQYLKQNPDAKITVASYCDKKTGSEKFNQKLSEKRSAAVVKVLKNKYGISESRLNVVNNGDKQQPFSENNSWNRVTIMTSK